MNTVDSYFTLFKGSIATGLILNAWLEIIKTDSTILSLHPVLKLISYTIPTVYFLLTSIIKLYLVFILIYFAYQYFLSK